MTCAKRYFWELRFASWMQERLSPSARRRNSCALPIHACRLTCRLFAPMILLSGTPVFNEETFHRSSGRGAAVARPQQVCVYQGTTLVVPNQLLKDRRATERMRRSAKI